MDNFLTPQQAEFLANYTNPNSETFGNARQSALKAKYAETYANNITTIMPDWLLENVGRHKTLKKAERVLEKTLDYEPIDEEGKLDKPLLKIQNDTAKFVAETVGKANYSKRSELTGANGETISFNVVSYGEKPDNNTV